MDLSVIIPVYNEEESLPDLHLALRQALSDPALKWEVIYINDGSQDGSIQVLERLAEEDPEHSRVVDFRRNFGQTAAIAAGIDYSQGEIIVLMDADLQNDPQDIPMMIEKIHQGYDVVSGWRANRQDAFFSRTLPSRIANWLISTVTGVHLHDYGCTLKAYRREVITNKPIYLFGGAGILLMLISSIAMLLLAVRRLVFNIPVLSSPIFQVSTMVFILGFQSILMGLIAEMQVRTYHESQQKPTYSVRRLIGLDTQEKHPAGMLEGRR